jgi:hypothetical protein
VLCGGWQEAREKKGVRGPGEVIWTSEVWMLFFHDQRGDHKSGRWKGDDLNSFEKS